MTPMASNNQAGISAWISSIRTNLANDTGRQFFDDRIQANGFLFLDDYLDNILAGARKDPIIELVKTPGRKKTAPKRTRAATAAATKLKSVIALSQEAEEPLEERQRTVVILDFPEIKPEETTTSKTPAPLLPPETLQEPEEIIQETAPALEPHALAPPRAETKELSMIAEDDEECSPQPPSAMEVILPTHEPESPKLAPKKSIAQFPTLPAPSPPRKSMRPAREPSTSSLATTTPNVAGTFAAPVTGKRTSWLQKARELKAMEELTMAGKKVSVLSTTTNITSTQSMNVPTATSGLKRKSGEMLNPTSLPFTEETDRKNKAVKLNDENTEVFGSKGKQKQPENPAPLPQPELLQPVQESFNPPAPISVPIPVEDLVTSMHVREQDIIGRLKRTVEGLNARAGKDMGKSLGGAAAANALAEARAAAEARVAERNNFSTEATSILPESCAFGEIAASSTEDVRELKPHELTPPPKQMERRLSVSDLFTEDKKIRVSEKVFQAPPIVSRSDSTRIENTGSESISTTPPNSPPPQVRSSSFVLPSGPVFIPPAPRPLATKTALPPVMSLGVPARLPSPSSLSQLQLPRLPAALSAQSTLASVSDGIFDRDDDVPAWVPRSQDTEYSSVFGSQADLHTTGQNCLDEDDSWPLSEKIAAANQVWKGKEDSMTWSTVPTESQRGDTGPVQHVPRSRDVAELDASDEMQVDAEDEDDDLPGSEMDREVMYTESDLERLGLNPGQSTISLVEAKMDGTTTRSQSQMSMASTSSSQQSQMGFFGQATKLVNSVLGVSKKGKPEVKSLQRAAAAAKKQREEKDKKAARMKDMEARRQLAIQRKAEEEKARALEEEKKIKEESERRKREREEHTDKRPLKPATKKADGDITKKRKVVVEIERKPEFTNPPPKEKKETAPSRIKPVKSIVPAASTTTKGKGKAPAPPFDDEIAQPSNIVQSQMAARAKAQMQAAKAATEATVASESIELPDINSEYSDSEDEDRPRTFDPPDWAQSPELRQALQMQSTVNPDDIFGVIRPLKMEELFRTRQSRFRARTSSANWTGTDRLTVEEEREYARRMGFK